MQVTLSQTSKMPSKSISISAFLCKNGSKLAEVPGTVCNKCYARRGYYHMPSVKKAMADRLAFMESIDFVPRMIAMLGMEDRFRWFDSGDIQSEQMAHDILDVIEGTPWVAHWLPSKEYTMWRNVLKTRTLPSNVALRLSTPKDDTRPIKTPQGAVTSTTYTHKYSPSNTGYQCIAHKIKEQTGQYNCGPCRACWDTNVQNIAYPKRYESKNERIKNDARTRRIKKA